MLKFVQDIHVALTADQCMRWHALVNGGELYISPCRQFVVWRGSKSVALTADLCVSWHALRKGG